MENLTENNFASMTSEILIPSQRTFPSVFSKKSSDGIFSVSHIDWMWNILNETDRHFVRYKKALMLDGNDMRNAIIKKLETGIPDE